MRRLARHRLRLSATRAHAVDDGARPQHGANARPSCVATTSPTAAVHLEPKARR